MLIDTEDLRQAMYHEAFETDTDLQKWDSGCWIRYKLFEKVLETMPSAQPELIRCKDCLFGYLYFDVQNDETDSWVECRNPDGLNRDVSCNEYCSASIRRKKDED